MKEREYFPPEIESEPLSERDIIATSGEDLELPELPVEKNKSNAEW